jgi:hypothetical protein
VRPAAGAGFSAPAGKEGDLRTDPLPLRGGPPLAGAGAAAEVLPRLSAEGAADPAAELRRGLGVCAGLEPLPGRRGREPERVTLPLGGTGSV